MDIGPINGYILRLFTRREEDPRRRNNFSFALHAEISAEMSGYQVEKEKKNDCRPLAAERPAAAMFVLFVPGTRIFRAKAVSARKVLSLGRS